MLNNQNRVLSSDKEHSPLAAQYRLIKRRTSRGGAAFNVDTRADVPQQDRTLQASTQETVNAQARLLALSLLADGQMDSCEVELLGGHQGLGRLQISRAQFSQVLNDLCADVSRMPVTGESYSISPAYVEALLGKVTDSQLRRTTLNLMFDVIRSDGKLDRSEAALLWNALDSWGLRVSHLGKAGVNSV